MGEYELLYEIVHQSEADLWRKILIAIISSVLGSSCLITLIVNFVQRKAEKRAKEREDEREAERKRIEQEKEENNAERKMLLGLAHEKIIDLAIKYIDREFITREEYDNLNKYLYSPYKDLKGNGTVEKLMAEVEHLPIKCFSHLRTDKLKENKGGT